MGKTYNLKIIYRQEQEVAIIYIFTINKNVNPEKNEFLIVTIEFYSNMRKAWTCGQIV